MRTRVENKIANPKMTSAELRFDLMPTISVVEGVEWFGWDLSRRQTSRLDFLYGAKSNFSHLLIM